VSTVLNASDRYLIHTAALNGQVDALRALLSVPDSNADTLFGECLDGTPLHYAADRGHLECVKLLIDNGASLDAHNRQGATPLAFASARGHIDCARVLLAAGARVDALTVQAAATAGRVDCMELLIERVRLPPEIATLALHDAASGGHAACMTTLLGVGAGVNVRRTDGATALHLAAQLGHDDCVEVCIAAGADVDARDGSCMDATALHRAAMTGHVKCIELLIHAGADLDAVTAGRGHTALHIACHVEHIDCVKALLCADATIDIPDVNGQTSIQYVLDSGLDRVETAFTSVLRTRVCGQCRRSNQHARLRLCKRCRVTRYCDVACQTAHWAEHRCVCAARL